MSVYIHIAGSRFVALFIVRIHDCPPKLHCHFAQRAMYYDLNVVWPAQVQSTSAAGAGAASSNEALKSKKQKGKQRAVEDTGAASNKHGLELLIEADRTELRKSVEMAIKRESGVRKNT